MIILLQDNCEPNRIVPTVSAMQSLARQQGLCRDLLVAKADRVFGKSRRLARVTRRRFGLLLGSQSRRVDPKNWGEKRAAPAARSCHAKISGVRKAHHGLGHVMSLPFPPIPGTPTSGRVSYCLQQHGLNLLLVFSSSTVNNFILAAFVDSKSTAMTIVSNLFALEKQIVR